MSKKNDSQTQQESQQDSRNDANDRRTSDPFAFMFSGFDTWAQVAGQMAEKTTRDNIDRIQSFYNEMADFENVAYSRAKKSAQDVGDMMSESITYMTDLGREWRKLTVDATRRSAQMFGPRS